MWCHDVGCHCQEMGRAIGAKLDWEILTTHEGVTKRDAGTMKAHALSRRYSSATLSTRSIRVIHEPSLGTGVFIYSSKKKKKVRPLAPAPAD